MAGIKKLHDLYTESAEDVFSAFMHGYLAALKNSEENLSSDRNEGERLGNLCMEYMTALQNGSIDEFAKEHCSLD